MKAMIEVKEIARLISFWELLESTNIEIPIIQRDYALGRAGNNKKRKEFLEAMHKSLKSEPLELDFVYGSEEHNSMYPLDGQQRLTTLFLIYWYLGTKENLLDDSKKVILKKFTYKTRSSSNEFCNALIDSKLIFNRTSGSISQIIEEQFWFFNIWKSDPTIKAMLNMLESIHEEFRDVPKTYFTKLIDSKNCPIKFHYLKLDEFGLSDDLYIKMNARGKHLTPFENFKADLIKEIDEKKWEMSFDIFDTTSHKIDTIWADLFWNDGLGEKSFDSDFLTFISKATLISIANSDTKIELIEDKIKLVFNNQNELNVSDHFDKNVYNTCYQYLDLYSSKSLKEYSFDIPFWHLTNDKSFFELILEGDVTYPQIVLFYAQTVYFQKNPKIDNVQFSNWIRVIRNILMHSTIDSAPTFIGAIRLVKEISSGCSNIYDYLKSKKVISSFAALQVEEEVLKAQIISLNNKQHLFAAEDTNFCKGKIRFVLYCLDINKSNLNLDTVKLAKFTKVLIDHLDKRELSNQFRRALLTIKDSNFYNYWTSWLYMVDEPKRCLIEDINELKSYSENNQYKNYLKDILILLCDNKIEDVILDFINKNPNYLLLPNWKKRIISDSSLLDDYCKSHYFSISEDQSHCYLLNVGRPRKMSSCHMIK